MQGRSVLRGSLHRRFAIVLGGFLAIFGGEHFSLLTHFARAQTIDTYTEDRKKMVNDEIVAAGVKDPRVIESARNTPRHEFVAPEQRKLAYLDMSLPIGEGATISAPFIVSYMTEQLLPKPEDKVLEIGTGSGYQAAILSPLVKEVYSIEIVPSLGQKARETLLRLKYENVHVKIGDGYQGWAEHAPFDKIIVTCSPEKVPEKLVEQLKEGGLLVIPVGERYQQTLYRYTKLNGKLVGEELLPIIFVPMIGIAEEQRQVRPDPTRPAFVNGSFEELVGKEEKKPFGWYYLRQASLTHDNSPEGKNHILLQNEESGRYSQMLQGMAIDGRAIKEIEITLSAKGDKIKSHSEKSQPGLYLTFYDEKRRTVQETNIGRFKGTFGWKKTKLKVRIPAQAREAIIAVGLLGGTGQLEVDNLQLTVTKKGN